MHGSDYPVPAINLVIHTSRLRRYVWKSYWPDTVGLIYIVTLCIADCCTHSLSLSFSPPSLSFPSSLSLLILPHSLSFSLSHPSLSHPLHLRFGLITADQCRALNELYHYNPLLFDFATKRVLRGPSGESFPVSIFKQHPLLPPSREPTVSSVDPLPTKAEVNGDNDALNTDSSYVHRPAKVTTEVNERP